MKRFWFNSLAIAVAIGAAGTLAAAPKKAPAAAQKKAPAARDWTRVVTATPAGGFLMGNPNAPVKVVEYGSFTCNHCANFATQGMPVLVRDYVKSGKASFEYRSFVRDPFDMTAALAARCAAPARFFGLAHSIFAGQSQWMGKIQALPADQAKAIDALPVPERVVRFAGITGFDAMARQAGVPAAKLKQCLTDKKATDQLVAMHQAAVAQGLQGTPAFLVNGKMTDAHSWAALQPLLGPPGG